MSDHGRTPLRRGDELYLNLKDAKGNSYSQKAVVEELIGKGATCLTYTVALYKDDATASRMIMKEFYPQAWTSENGVPTVGIHVEREGKEIKIKVEPCAELEFLQEKLRFREAYMMQNILSGSEAMEIMVKPYQIAEYGDSQYLLSDIHKGEVLKLSEIDDFAKKIWLIYRTAEAISLLHEQGYLYMDLNPNNILWIDSQQIVKLFDVDSIIPYKKLDEIHEIRVTKPYVAPEIEELEDWFEINKKTFLKPSWDIYCLGLLLFEMVFGRFPTGKDLETSCGQEGELEAICSQNEYDEEILALLKKILKRSLSRKFRTRYHSAEEMCAAVNELKIRIDARAFISKKEFAKANATMKAYYMLDRWPLYRYVNDKKEQDIAIVGNHPMREDFVKAVYSCTHMLDSITRIRIYAKDAKVFWDDMEAKNPLLSQTIKLYLNGVCIRTEHNKIICQRPIAEVHLYENEESKIESNYILLLKDKRECKESICKIKEQCKNISQKLIAYLDDGSNFISQEEYPEHRILPVSMRNKCSYYDESLLETELLKRALKVHALYYRNNHKRASWEEMKEDFESNIYNIESSMRCALTVKYKLFSIGLQIEKQDIAECFYEKVLSDTNEAKVLYRKLVALEHLSWSSFLIVNGWNLPTREQVEEYAFVGKNDFKEKERRLHPCLVECGAEKGLEGWRHEEWELPIETNKKVQQLDRLDLTSILLHQIAKEKAKKAMKRIDSLAETLGESVQGYRFVDLQNAYQWMDQVKGRIFAGEVTAESLWRQAEYHFLETAKKLGISNPQFKELTDRMRQELRVINEYNSFHEYKKSDGAIISGMPYILTEETVTCVVKPYVAAKNHPWGNSRWENIRETLYLEPEKLIFVSQCTEEDRKKVRNEIRKEELDFYKEFLKKRGVKTKISVRRQEEVLQEKEEYAEALFLSRQKETMTGLSAQVKSQLSRKIHLQVEELFELFGERQNQKNVKWNPTTDERERTALLLGDTYQKIWHAYRMVGPGAWKQMTKKLSLTERKTCYRILEWKQSNDESARVFQTEPVNGSALYLADIHKILRRCKEEGLIEDYFYPAEKDELSVRIKTESEKVFFLINELIQKVIQEPLKHRYRFVEEKDGKYNICDDGLYTRLRSIKEELKETFKTVEEQGKDSARQQILLQNFRIKNGTVSFKYASEAVKKCLQSQDMILDIVLYYVCQSLGRFDDIRIGKGNKIWCSEDTKLNCVSANIIRIDETEFLEVCCEKDYFSLLGETEKEVYRYPISAELKEIQKDIYKFFCKKKN